MGDGTFIERGAAEWGRLTPPVETSQDSLLLWWQARWIESWRTSRIFMAQLHYQNLDIRRPDSLMKHAFYGLCSKLSYIWARQTIFRTG